MPRLPAPDTAHLLPEWPPSLQLLLGEPAGDLWSAVLDQMAGRLRGLRATSVTLQPDGAATVQYSADVAWADGRLTRQVLAATTGSRIPAGAAVVESSADGGVPVRVGLWRWPLDPALPGLAWAASAAATGERLAELGLTTDPVRLTLRSYRPGRRAVVEATTAGDRRFFLKVVRPRAVDALVRRHELLAAAAPVPPVLAASPDGVVVLPQQPGTPLRALLADPAPAALHNLPGPDTLDAVLDALPEAAAELPARGTNAPGDALARAGHHAAVIAAVAPDLRQRLDALTAQLATAERGEHPWVPVHGDFYEGQLLVEDGAVVGLLDVDTAGRGHRIDEWANLLAHLVVLDRVVAEPANVVRYRERLLAAALTRWPAAQLHPRIAAVLVGLATGPFRVQQPGWPERTDARLALAEEWARHAVGG